MTGYFTSASEPDYYGQDYLNNPDIAGLHDDWMMWIVDNGSLRDMTRDEYESIYPAPVVPDWDQFRRDMIASSEWNRIESVVSIAKPTALISLEMFVMKIRDGEELYRDSVEDIWNGVIDPVANITSAEATALNTIFTDNDIDFTVASDGTISCNS